MSHKKPPPLGANEPSRKRCPVCGDVSYSKAGIHPQCALQRSESLRLQRVKKQAVAAPPAGNASQGNPLRRWDKTCPKCGARIHVRKKTCDCGYAFGSPGA